MLLDGYLRAPGRVLIERGVDHYLGRATDLEEKLLALVRVLVAELEPGLAERGDPPSAAARAAVRAPPP